MITTKIQTIQTQSSITFLFNILRNNLTQIYNLNNFLFLLHV